MKEKKTKNRDTYYNENRFRICKRTLEVYFPRIIALANQMAKETVTLSYQQYPYSVYAEPVFRRKARRKGLRENHVWFQECQSAAHYCYMYAVSQCAIRGYDYVVPYIKKMVGLSIVLGLGSSDEFQNLCKENHFKPVYPVYFDKQE